VKLVFEKSLDIVFSSLSKYSGAISQAIDAG
jgi:hypothetical protein